MKKFAEGSASLAKVAENADPLAVFSSALSKFADSFAPLAAPIEVLAAQLTAGTMESTIKLMESMFKLMENPIIVTTIEGVIWGLNKIVEGGIKFTEWLDKNLVPMVATVKTKYVEDLKPILDALIAWIGTIGTTIDNFMNWWDLNVQPALDTTGKKFKDFIALLDIDLAGAFDKIGPYFDALLQVLKDISGIDLTAFFNKIWQFFTNTDVDGKRYIEA
jgi:hypothetical protein